MSSFLVRIDKKEYCISIEVESKQKNPKRPGKMIDAYYEEFRHFLLSCNKFGLIPPQSN